MRKWGWQGIGCCGRCLLGDGSGWESGMAEGRSEETFCREDAAGKKMTVRFWEWQWGKRGGSLECREGWAAGLAGDGGGRDERKVRSVEEMLSPEVELGMAGDGDGGDGGAAVRSRRRRRPEVVAAAA